MDLSSRLSETILSTEEQHVLLLGISFENGCDYCMAANTSGAKQAGVKDEWIDAVWNGEPIEDDRLQTLRTFAVEVVRKRGHVQKEDIEAFLSVGYEQKKHS